MAKKFTLPFLMCFCISINLNKLTAQVYDNSNFQYTGRVSTYIHNSNYSDGTYGAMHFNFRDGQAMQAQFGSITGVAILDSGDMYISDAPNGRIRFYNMHTGMVSTFAGNGTGKQKDGPLSSAIFTSLGEIQLDKNGNIYVIDGLTLRKISTDHIVSTVYSAEKKLMVNGKEKKIKSINHFTIDDKGEIYLTLSKFHAIFHLNSSGELNVYAGQIEDNGYVNGKLKEAKFDSPQGLCFKKNGELIVADELNEVFRKIDTDGNVSTFAGKRQGQAFVDFGNDGPAQEAKFKFPQFAAEDAMGNVLVTDKSHLIRMITKDDKVVTLAGNNNFHKNGIGELVDGGYADGYAQNAIFMYPGPIVFGYGHRAFIVDQNGLRFMGVVRSDKLGVSSTKSVTTSQTTFKSITSATKSHLIAGSEATQGFEMKNNDQGFLAAFGSDIDGMVMGKDNNIYIADRTNQLIRKVTLAGNVSTFAGTYKLPPVNILIGKSKGGYKDGPALQAMFDGPNDVAIDSKGNLFVADMNNHRIRKISLDSIVTTFAGGGKTGKDGGGYADGKGTDALFSSPISIAVDENDNLFVADAGNAVIRKITPEGMVTTVTGKPSAGLKEKPKAISGKFGVGRFGFPRFVRCYNNTLLVTDKTSNCIWTVDKNNGEINVLAGTGAQAGMDGAFKDGPFKESMFYGPIALLVQKDGSVLIGDYMNYRIRRLDMQTKTVSTYYSHKLNDDSNNANNGAELLVGAMCAGNDGKIYFFDSKNLMQIDR